ncbi:hypothetical protein LMG667_20185, partial [Xanthomonas euvesicatoria]
LKEFIVTMKVFLHTRSPEHRDWLNEKREFARIPVVGEHVAISSDGPWFKVELVVHTPFPCEFDAEVYAVAVDHLQVLNEALDG